MILKGSEEMENKKIYTVNEFAEIMGVKPLTVRRWIASGDLRTIKIGKAIRIPSSELEKKGE